MLPNCRLIVLIHRVIVAAVCVTLGTSAVCGDEPPDPFQARRRELDAQHRAEQQRRQQRRLWEPMILDWLMPQEALVSSRDKLHDALFTEFVTQWLAKVLTLIEFGGLRDGPDREWDELERDLLTELRRALTTLPLFVDRDRPIEERRVEMRWFLRPDHPSHTELLADERRLRWTGMDREPYVRLAIGIQQRIDNLYHARYSERDIRDNQVAARSKYLLGMLVSNVLMKNGYFQRDIRVPRLGVWEHELYEELKSSGILTEAAAPPEKAAALTALQRAFCRYVQASLPRSKLFENLSRHLTDEEFREWNSSYNKREFTPEEASAREAVLQLLENEILRMPKTLPPHTANEIVISKKIPPIRKSEPSLDSMPRITNAPTAADAGSHTETNQVPIPSESAQPGSQHVEAAHQRNIRWQYGWSAVTVGVAIVALGVVIARRRTRKVKSGPGERRRQVHD